MAIDGIQVLFGYNNVLFVWRELDLLFQAHCFYRRIFPLLCDSSSLHFLGIVPDGFDPLSTFSNAQALYSLS